MCIFVLHKQIERHMERNVYPNRLRIILAERMLTNKWLSEKMKVSEMTISRWKTNKIQPSMSQFVELSLILNVDINELIDNTSNTIR